MDFMRIANRSMLVTTCVTSCCRFPSFVYFILAQNLDAYFRMSHMFCTSARKDRFVLEDAAGRGFTLFPTPAT